MQVRIYVGLVAILFSSACTSLDKGVQQSKQKTTVGQRVERFAKSLTQTVTDVAGDVLPILGATTKEVVDEIKSDLPKMAEELNSQMSHIVSTRGSRETGH
jgi:NADH:ubiquinone oxidoreductase subunit 6 (subunit J)